MMPSNISILINLTNVYILFVLPLQPFIAFLNNISKLFQMVFYTLIQLIDAELSIYIKVTSTNLNSNDNDHKLFGYHSFQLILIMNLS